jgi:uncharacterized protein (DUF362 family)
MGFIGELWCAGVLSLRGYRITVTTSPQLVPSFSRHPSRVAIRKIADYSDQLESLVFESLLEFQLNIQGKHVLLKPNLVTHDPDGFRGTHPAVICAVRESFLRLGAQSVTIGEGPALERDTESILESVRFRDYFGAGYSGFVDLNLDDTSRVNLQTRASQLKQLYLPKTVLRSDFVVSIAKLKTHHWSGVTLSLKNMFGVVPGGCYGWPKNVLHWAGIDRAILDINSTVRPDFAIVDGVLGMEGDGPTQGTPKKAGVIVMGDDPVAVDSTCTRIMGLRPERVKYLAAAGNLLGHLQENKIVQIAEQVTSVRTPFAVIEDFQDLRAKEWPSDCHNVGRTGAKLS